MPVDTVRPLLHELTRAHLLTEHVPDHYTFHDLLRAYAIELGTVTDSDDGRRVAQHRLLDHYLHSANAAASLLRSLHERPVAFDPLLPGVVPESPADPPSALRWLSLETRTLVVAPRQAIDLGLDGHAWRLAWVLQNFLDRQGRWPELIHVQQLALQAARRSGDRAGQANAHEGSARAFLRMGDYEESERHLLHALELHRLLKDQTGEAQTLSRLGLVRLQRGRDGGQDLVAHAEPAIQLFRAIGDEGALANALNNVGWLHALAGHYQETVRYCSEALSILESHPDPAAEGNAADSLGYAHHHLGEYDEAIACYRRALKLQRATGNLFFEATTLAKLGDSHNAAGARSAAISAWCDSLTILDRFGHPDAAEVRAKLDAALSEADGSDEVERTEYSGRT